MLDIFPDFLINAMHRGGWFMWPILLCAIASLLIAAVQLYRIRRANADGRALFAAVAARIEADDVQGAVLLCMRRPKAAVSQVLLEILTEHEEGVTSLSRVADYATMAQRGRMGTHNHVLLPMLANVAVICGVLGTIQGLVMGFGCY